MADASPSPAAAEPNPSQSSQSNQPDPSRPPSSLSVPVNPSPIPLPPAIIPPLQQPQAQPPQIPGMLPPLAASSFRPATPQLPVPSASQFSPLPVQPPGVGAAANSTAGPMVPPSPYAPPGQLASPALRPPFQPLQNGYTPMHLSAPQGTIHPGIPRYPSQYNPMVRPTFLPRPSGGIGSMPPVLRPPIGSIRGPVIPPVIRPVAATSVAATATELPQTTVYIGKISNVENDFILPILQLCGPVKNWKRAQDPTSGKPKGFGICEFETAEGILRALRLLSKLNVDGQELLVNITKATRQYLEHYIEKKAQSAKKPKETENVGAEKEEENTKNSENSEPSKMPGEESKKDDKDTGSEEKKDYTGFGVVTDEDREADRDALEKITHMIEERIKNNPLPPPPPLPAADASGNVNLEQPTGSQDDHSDLDKIRNGDDKRDDEIASEGGKPSSEQERRQTSSPDRTRISDRRSRDRERDLKRDKERELERYERERELERARRERDREYKNKEDDRRYKARVKEWESRERDKEYLRKLDKEKEKEREYKRKREIMDQELEGDDGDSRRRKHKSSIGSEERKRRIREKEDDLADRIKEEEEIAEAKRRAEEELRQLKEREKEAFEPVVGSETNGSDKAVIIDQTNAENRKDIGTYDGNLANENHVGDGILQNGNGDESVMGTISTSEVLHNNNISAKKLGFGLVGSGKRTTLHSVFNQEEDEDAHKDKKMRPLVPIDYSTEELQAVHTSTPGVPPPNLAAAAEYAKRISSVNSKDERPESERERSKRAHDRSSHRDRNGDDSHRSKDESRKETVERNRDREQRSDKTKTPDNQKLLDAKQLIDTIPKTKDELFLYEINWPVYDKNELHNRMRPWISKKITEFLGEEEPTLVDYIVSSTQEHVKASEMLERLQSILDDEAEMFVLKMWRMLIFEIKKIETGLALRPKT